MATTGAKYATSALWVHPNWYLSDGSASSNTTQAKAEPVINSKYTDYLYINKYKDSSTIALNGFNFSELPQQATITSYTFSIRGGPYVGSPVGGNRLYAQLGHDTIITDWSNQQQWARNGTYSEIGEQIKFIDDIKVGNTTVKTYSYTFDKNNTNDLNGLAWMNSHIAEIKNNNLGLFLNCMVFKLYYVTLELEYTVPTIITTKISPSNSGSVTGGGAYTDGTSITLTATPSTGYKFKQWSDGNTNNPRTITVSGDATYTAIFESDSKIYNGTTKVQKIYLGTTPIKKIYIGTTQIF